MNDGEYFRRRAEQERAAVGRATHLSAARAHLDLAQAYETRAARQVFADAPAIVRKRDEG